MRIKRKGGVSYIGEGKGGRFSKLPMWDKIKRENWALILIKPQRLHQNKIRVVTFVVFVENGVRRKLSSGSSMWIRI